MGTDMSLYFAALDLGRGAFLVKQCGPVTKLYAISTSLVRARRAVTFESSQRSGLLRRGG